MRVAVTGANGFIGQAVVSALLDAGHHVDALVRNNFPQHWQSETNVHLHHCELLKNEGINTALDKSDAVIHLAAVMQGANQYHDSLTMTRNVLSAMEAADVHQLIALSSIAVLDYVKTAAMSEINENTPINLRDSELGDYARMKRDQEQLLAQWGENAKQLLILRPGLVYSDTQLSNAHAGFKVFHAKHNGEVPLVHVKDVASACVDALTYDASSQEIMHLLDTQRPSQEAYLQALKKRNALSSGIALPWQLFGTLMCLLRIPFTLIHNIPDGVRSNSVCARQKPFRFSDAKAQRLLNWQSTHALEI